MSNFCKGLLAASAAALIAGTASAAIQVVGGGAPFSQPGWDQPPASLGDRTMTPYATYDPRFGPGIFAEVPNAWADAAQTHVTTFGGQTFGHRTIGAGWATWSGGYTGSIYYSNGSAAVDLTFSSSTGLGTKGFYFFIEPNPFAVHSFTVTATSSSGAVSVHNQAADGSAGATWFGIYATGGESISSVLISSDQGVDFAIGRFGYNLVPAPGAMALLGLAGLAGRRRRA